MGKKKRARHRQGHVPSDHQETVENAEEIGKEVLVEHRDAGHIHKRRVKFVGGIDSLREAILKCYDDIIVPKIATSIRISEADARLAKNEHEVARVLYIAVHDNKFGENVEILDGDDVKGGDKILVHVIKKEPESNAKSISVDKLEESYDIALEIKSMKLHIHVSDGDHHRFVPYWTKWMKIERACGFFPPGVYRIWCPVYAEGQGFVTIDDENSPGSDLYNVAITGYTSINPEGNSIDVKFEISPISDECRRIKFTKNNAYLGYEYDSGAVFASTNPGEKQGKFNFDFKIVQLDGKYGMYYQIFDKNGVQPQGKSHYLQVTEKNRLIRVIHEVDILYKDPASLFTVYRQSTKA